MKQYINTILAIIFVVLGVYSFMITKSLKSAEKEREQWENNFVEVQGNVRMLSLKIDDVTKVQGLKMDSILKVAKIKPGQVTQYIDSRTIFNSKDTTITNVVRRNDSTYVFSDTAGCVKVKGLVTVRDTLAPDVLITTKSFESNAQYIFYNKRRSYKFLFWKWSLFGKKENKLEIITDCGKTTATNLEIIK